MKLKKPYHLMTRAQQDAKNTSTLIKAIAFCLVIGLGGVVLVIYIDVALNEAFKARINDSFSIVIALTVAIFFVIAIYFLQEATQ